MSNLNLFPVNFCITDILSVCGAGTTWPQQQYCRFAEKSDFANKCMYFNFSMERHCDSMDAQKDAIKRFA